MIKNLKAHPKDALKVGPIWQKMTEKFSSDDPRVPKALPMTAVPLPSGAGNAVCVTDDGAFWVGNDEGLVRYAPKEYKLDQVQFFNGQRYLADNKVLALLPEGNGVWVRTEKGVSHIWYQKMTMAEKAAIYDSRILTRQTRHGFIDDAVIKAPGDFSDVKHFSSDNDGLWTAMYAAGACYEYAVTGSEDALKRAKTTVEAVLSLVDVTGIKGYFARSFVTKDEPLPADGFWITKDDGNIIWKSDTSSDEAVGHYMIYLIAYELLPDEALRARIKKAVTEITDYIIANNYYLIDVTGKPTYWGNWNLDYFKGRGYEDTSLNAAELLSHVKVTAHITGEKRFEDEYKKLANDLGYADLCLTYLERKNPHTINYSDEELCYLSYLPLVMLEDDPVLREKYKKAMGQWWINIQRELNPLWAYIYNLIDPELDYDMEGCLWTLRRLPVDMMNYKIENENRKDLIKEDALDRHRNPQVLNLYAPDERRIMKWNGNPFNLNGGGNGLSEEPGTVYTLPYWLGRYYGFLIEE